MKPKCESCNSCGMPLASKDDCAMGDLSSRFCKYCVNEVGELLPFETLLKSNAAYFQESQGITPAAATEMAANLLLSMPAWKSARG